MLIAEVILTIFLVLWAAVFIAGWVFIIALLRLKPDPCPREYEGFDCKRKTNWPCDHSNRVWALKGIDKDELHGQPTRGSWNDPLRKDET